MTSRASENQDSTLRNRVLSFGESDENTKSTSRLIRFLGSTYHILNMVSKSGRDPLGELLFFERFHGPILVAWQEMPGHFQELAAAIERATESRLKANGITQKRLDHKLLIVTACWNRFVTSGGHHRAKDLLVSINDLLVPTIEATGVAWALQEYVETLIGCLDDIKNPTTIRGYGDGKQR